MVGWYRYLSRLTSPHNPTPIQTTYHRRRRRRRRRKKKNTHFPQQPNQTPIQTTKPPKTEEEEDEEEEFLLDDDGGYGSPSQVGFSLSLAGPSSYLSTTGDDAHTGGSASAMGGGVASSAPASSGGGSTTTDAYFAHVVHDMVVSGYASRHPVANILLEVKSFKFAHNRTFAAVVAAAVPALLDLALDPEVVNRQAAADAEGAGVGGGKGGGKGKGVGGGGGGGGAVVGGEVKAPVVLPDKEALAKVEAQLEYWDALLQVGVWVCVGGGLWMCVSVCLSCG
jgi:hypothetical protein